MPSIAQPNVQYGIKWFYDSGLSLKLFIWKEGARGLYCPQHMLKGADEKYEMSLSRLRCELVGSTAQVRSITV